MTGYQGVSSPVGVCVDGAVRGGTVTTDRECHPIAPLHAGRGVADSGVTVPCFGVGSAPTVHRRSESAAVPLSTDGTATVPVIRREHDTRTTPDTTPTPGELGSTTPRMESVVPDIR